MNETPKILDPNEQVLWQGQPQWLPYVISSFSSVIVGLVWFTFFSPFAVIGIGTAIKSSAPWPVFVFLIPFVLFGLVPLLLPIYRMISYKYIWYVITDKRVILQSGWIARVFDVVDYDKVESATVEVDIMDKLFGKNSGDIMIYANRLVYQSGNQYGSGGTTNVPFRLYHITDPYGTFELFKKTSFDVKADINYPNALRPAEDKGYQTTYEGKQPQPPAQLQ